ncbi:MAG: cytochrome P450 [Phototrophicaceae bacterium]
MRLDPIAYLSSIRDRYGSFVMWDDATFVYGPELTKAILSSKQMNNQTLRGPEGSGLEILLNGLVFLNGEEHDTNRRAIQPVFHRQEVQSYFDTLTEIATDVISKMPSDKSFNITPYLADMTFRSTLANLFGVSADLSDLGDLINRWVIALTNPIGYLLPYNIPFTPYSNLLKISEKLVQDTRKTLESVRLTNDGSILKMLLDSNTELTDEQIIGHVNLIFLAGYETTRNSLTFIIYLLAQHPDIAITLQDEIRSMDGDLSSLMASKNLTNVINEALRLYPPTSWIDKYANDNVMVGGHQFEKGMMFLVPHYLNHRDENIFENPNSFIPDRWNTLTNSLLTYAFIPFSAGPRQCIGSEFAKMMIRVFIFNLLNKHSFKISEGQQLDRLVRATLRVKQPMKVSLGDNFERVSVRGDIPKMLKYIDKS